MRMLLYTIKKKKKKVNFIMMILSSQAFERRKTKN